MELRHDRAAVPANAIGGHKMRREGMKKLTREALHNCVITPPRQRTVDALRAGLYKSL
jgi:hypothetical protein